MTILLKLLSRAVVMALLCGGLANCADPTFSLSISVPQDILNTGSEVRVRIILKNVTNHEIRLIHVPIPGDDGGDAIMYGGSVVDGDGNPAPYTTLGARRWNGGGGDYSLTFTEAVESVNNCRLGTRYTENRQASGCAPFCSAEELAAANRDCGVAKHSLVVSRLCDLSKPGKYTIQLTRYDPESKTVVKSNAITVTITP